MITKKKGTDYEANAVERDERSFSVIINTYNRASILRNALESLAQLRHPNFEAIVVNGPSTDESAEVISRFRNSVKALKCPEANLSMSRNIGIAAACGDICCFMDDDAVPEPDWLNQLDEAYADPAVGGVGGFTRDHTGVSFQTRALLCDPFGDSRNFKTLAEAEKAMAEDDRLYFSQTGTNSSFRRKALLEIGGFDEHFVYFLDETDVNFRLKEAGWKIAYAPNAEIHHKYAPSHLRTEKRVPKSLYFPARSKSYFILRNAARGKDISGSLEKIAHYELEISDHNKWYKETGVLDDQGYEELQESLSDGVLAGITAAYDRPDRQLLTQAKLSQYDSGPLKSYPTKKRAAERLKIAFLSQTYPPGDVGGIGVWTHVMATSLAKAGHELSVVTRQTRGDFDTVDFEEGVWVHRIAPRYQPKRTEPALPDLSQITKDHLYTVLDEIVRIDERRGLDIVSAPIWDIEGLGVVRDGRLPVVTSLHTTFKLCLPTKPDWLEMPGYKEQHVDKIIAAEEMLLEECAAVLGNSEGVCRDVAAVYEANLDEKLTIVPHGLPDLRTAFEALPDSSEFPKKVPGVTRVLFVGRFEDRKGVVELLQAIELAASESPNAEFVLVGDNEIVVQGDTHWRRFLERNKGAAFLNRVKAVGSVSDDDLLRHYEACDIFVAPSRYESFGLIFAEAMAFEKPCIGADVGGVGELVFDGKTGLLVPVNAPKALAEALNALIRDPVSAQSMGIAGRKRFEERFDAQKMAAAAEDFYRSTVSGFRTRQTTKNDHRELSNVL